MRVLFREITRITERKTIYLLSVILPIILFLLLALVYKNAVARDLPVAVYDQDNSSLSRLITRSIDASSSMEVTKHVYSLDELKSEFLKGHIQGAFYFPGNMESDVKKGRPSSMVIFKNTSSLIIGNLIYKDGVTIARTVSGGILLKKLRSKGLSESQAMNVINPVRIETQSLYNPGYNYLSYLVPGLLTALLQMIIMISAVLIISSEFTHGTFNELVEISGKNLFTLVSGKAFPHIALHTATALGIIGIIFPMFSIEINGSVWLTLAFIEYFILVSFFLGFLFSCMFHEQLFATEVAVFINTPAFIFSGFTFPLWGMPALHNYFAQLIPYTHFLSGFIKLYQMGTPLRYVMPEFLRLSVFLVISLIASFIVLRFRMNELPEIAQDKREEFIK
ncbi:MAG: ABC transporter permease [Ignavibacteria bacterium]|nr:ABC transporter permease [Ignavibacteria bacterium]MCU7504008.1 ABC transporter permease [Ignavibacteria bacterium]MCU7515380.1 ABC transporter permease [Ignavibacteria bacterium]